MEKEIGLIICGAGYMGKNALESIPILISSLKQQNVTIRLTFIIEPDFTKEKYDAIKKACKPLFYNSDPKCIPPIFQQSGHLLAFLDQLRPCLNKMTFIVYDASPTDKHFDNLTHFYNFSQDFPNIVYMGEKPLFIDPKNNEYAEKNLPSHFLSTANCCFFSHVTTWFGKLKGGLGHYLHQYFH